MFITLSAMTFTACKKDNDAGLEGTWKVAKIEYSFYENEVLRSSEVYYPNDTDNERLLAFQGNQWTSFYADEAIEYREEDTYVYSQGTLKLYDEEELQQEITVDALTDRNLVISTEESYENEGVSEREVTVYTYNRQ